jgi:hypothetical protein
MAISTVCPGCRTTYRLPDALRGKTARCKKCQSEFVVAPVSPQEETVEEAPLVAELAEQVREAGPRRRPPARRRPAGDEEEDAGPPRRPARPVAKSKTPWVIGFSIGGALVLAGAGVALWLILSGKGDEDGSELTRPKPALFPDKVIKPASRQIPLEGQDTQIKRILLAAPETNQAVLHYQIVGNKVTHRFDRYDLKTGKKLSSLEVPDLVLPHSMALSPDGTRLAIQGNSLISKVSVWSLPDDNGKGKRLVPDFNTEGSAVKTEVPNSHQWMEFLDSGRLLVVHERGTRTLWEVPGGKEVYSLKRPAGVPRLTHLDAFSKLPRDLALSPDRKTLALCNDDGFDFYDTATGKLLRKTPGLKAQGQLGNVWGTAFSPDGSQLVAFLGQYRRGPGIADHFLMRWEVKTGNKVSEAPLAWQVSVSSGLSWWTQGQLLVWNGIMNQPLLVDLDQGKYVRQFKLHGYGRMAPAVPGGLLWYASPQERLGKPFLTGVAAPSAEDLKAPAKANNPQTGVGQWFLTPDGIENQERPRKN